MINNYMITSLKIIVNILDQNLDFPWGLDASLNYLDEDFVVALNVNVVAARKPFRIAVASANKMDAVPKLQAPA